MSLGREFVFKILIVALFCAASFLCFYVFYSVVKKEKLSTLTNCSSDQEVSYDKNLILDDNEAEVQNLIFESKTENNESYKIKSLTAVKNHHGDYLMQKVSAEIQLGVNSLHIYANDALLKDNTDILDLSSNIIARYLGYDFLSENLEISLKNKKLSSPTKVVVRNNKFTINADSFESENNTKVVFKGNVKTNYNPD